MVCAERGEQEVWSRIVFCHKGLGALLEFKGMFLEKSMDVSFESMANPGFPAVLHAQRIADEILYPVAISSCIFQSIVDGVSG